MLMADAVTDQL